MSIKSIIFDFDGTLFDSMSIWETAGVDYLSSIGYIAEEGLSKRIKSMSLLQAAVYLKEQYALTFSVEEIMAGINKTVEDYYFYKVMPKDYVVSLLSSLKKKNIKMCIATATDRYQIEAALKRCDIFNYFEAIFTCSEIGYGKDQPNIFEIAREAMGTEKEETAVFEDASYAARTAKNAGFYVIGVYDRYEEHPEELKELADEYVSNFSEVSRLLHI